MSIRKEILDPLGLHPSSAGVRGAWVTRFLALRFCVRVRLCWPVCTGVACGPVGFYVKSVPLWGSGLRGHRRVLGNGTSNRVL